VRSASAAFVGSRPGRPGYSIPAPVADDDLSRAGGAELRRCRRASGSRAGQHDRHVLQPLPYDAQCVQERRQDDDRRPVLVVVKNGDVKLVSQPCFDFEAAGCSDVLEVDPAEAGRDRNDRADDLVRIRRREADRPGVDSAELLEEDRLSLHHRQRGLGADVAQAEHGRAVGHDGDGVLLDREVPDLLRGSGDRTANPRNAGGVGHREVVARLERRLGRDLELPAEMEQKGPVRDVLDLDSVDPSHRGDDAGDLGVVGGEHRDVAHLLAVLDSH